MVLSPPVPQKSNVFQKSFVFKSGHFPSAHASTIAETPHGLVAACFAGLREFDPGVGIWLSRQEGGQWTSPVEIANGIQYVKADGTPHRYR